MADGPMQGIPGVVEDAQGQFTLVAFTIFGKPVEIKVASCLLLNNVAHEGLPHGIAA